MCDDQFLLKQAHGSLPYMVTTETDPRLSLLPTCLTALGGIDSTWRKRIHLGGRKGGRDQGGEREGGKEREGGREGGRKGGREGGGEREREGKGEGGERERSGGGVMKEGGREGGVWVSGSVRCDGYTWTRCSHHGIGSTANITTCAGVRGGRGGRR